MALGALDALLGWAVGVTVDEDVRTVPLQGREHGVWVDVHDGCCFVSFGFDAAGFDTASELLALVEASAEELALPSWVAELAAELLVGAIVGTQSVAVHEQYSLLAVLD